MHNVVFLQGGGELTADSYKWNTPAHVDDNVTHHFEFIVDGDVIVDDLDLSTHEGNVRLSHVCRGDEGTPAPDLTIEKSADATSVNAEILGQTGQLGCIAPGALADMIVVDGDPVADISLLNESRGAIVAIIKDGRFCKDELQ